MTDPIEKWSELALRYMRENTTLYGKLYALVKAVDHFALPALSETEVGYRYFLRDYEAAKEILAEIDDARRMEREERDLEAVRGMH